MKRLLVLAVGGLLALPIAAKEITLDNITIQPGQESSHMPRAPWAGQWWSFKNGQLAKGWNGTTCFNWNDTSKKYEAVAGITANNLSPLAKYDALIEKLEGKNPGSALYELTGDAPGAGRFDHHVDPVEAAKYQADGISFGWWGHCNGWAAAALAEREPHTPIELEGIRFDVADLKGCLSEVFWGVQSDFTGSRYYSPGWREAHNTKAKELLDALNAGNPKPKAEYKDWYVTLLRKWYSDDTKDLAGDHEPSYFKDTLVWFIDYYKEEYLDAFADIKADVFHKIIVTMIKNQKKGVVFDMDAGEEVWNFPAHAYDTNITLKETRQDGTKVFKVETTLYYQSDGVDVAVLGVVEHEQDYTYELTTDAQGKILSGEWTGGSVTTHPDFAWFPTYNKTGPDTGENKKIEYGKLLKVLSKDHNHTDARIATIKVNGTASDTQRTGREATTTANPLAASGALSFTTQLLTGHGVDKVSYYEQAISSIGDGKYKALPQNLTLLGNGTGSDWALSHTPTTAGRKMFVVLAYKGTQLISYDELCVQYTVSGGQQPPVTTSDDSHEENDTQAQAKLLAAGTYNGLKCNDEDWFKFDVPANGEISVKISFKNSTGDLDMIFHGPNGQLSSSTSTADQETVSGTNLAAGAYFVRIYGYSGAKAPYDLTATIKAGTTQAPTDDQFEENDTLAQAKSISLGSYTNLKCADQDWFKVSLTAGQQIKIRAEFSHAEGDLDLYLDNASGTRLAYSYSTSDNEEITFKATTAGTYYIRVEGYDGAKAKYNLVIQ